MKISTLLPNITANIVKQQKTASVSREVKMYRRALQMLQQRGQEGAGRLYHGIKPEDFRALIGSGEIRPHAGAHGRGAYFWDNIPRQVYIRSPDSRGLSISKRHLDKIEYPNAYLNPERGKVLDPYKKHMVVSKDTVGIPATGDSYVIAPPDILRGVREDIVSQRLRPMDSAIFHRAEADLAMKKALVAQMKETGGYTFKELKELISENVQHPSKKYLKNLITRKVDPPVFPAGMRDDLTMTPRGKRKYRDEFTDAYDDLVNFGPHK